MASTRTHTTIEEIKSISENMSKLDMQEWIHRQANELLMVKNISMDIIEENKKLKEENEELKEEAEENKKLFDTTFNEFMKLKIEYKKLDDE
jgi:carbonic anhydrase